MWVKICNLNPIPKIGVTEPHSCRRRDLPLKVCFEACLLERRVYPSVGSLFTWNDFSSARGGGRCTPPCLILCSLACKNHICAGTTALKESPLMSGSNGCIKVSVFTSQRWWIMRKKPTHMVENAVQAFLSLLWFCILRDLTVTPQCLLTVPLNWGVLLWSPA